VTAEADGWDGGLGTPGSGGVERYGKKKRNKILEKKGQRSDVKVDEDEEPWIEIRGRAMGCV